ncbi:polysaccharide deacetylase family protein [Georgenia thermotolerans]|uniref:Polysaccharide deacetylase family protein n=1 Tax=Georgenia thermotolerans TaxID=527326 RepID=A0A7J5USM6_9MICO|nr:polysaccharide deacetylase family protein [Georgenia thermotolerans]KAE8765251.1 polysaccharide deacetylase family protein [Georgenia thermotolerans]
MRTTFAGIVALGLTGAAALLGPPASAQGGSVTGPGDTFHLNDSPTGAAVTVIRYGNLGDNVYVGDWDGDGRDTLLVRRGATFFVRNSNSTGAADRTFSYGDPGDVVVVGDWDGDGTDTLAVRRGNRYLLRNANTTGAAQLSFQYGDPRDVTVVGDWDGNGTDTLAVRRGNRYLLRNTNTTGAADRAFSYGDPGDPVLVGDWDGNGTDTLAVRRGNRYLLRDTNTTGAAGRTVAYGNPTDAALAGDWNADGTDTLGIRRPPALGDLGNLLGSDLERIPTSVPVVALSFDADSNDAALSSILTTLESRGVRATFFLTGDFTRRYPAGAAAIAAAGHRLGNHSNTHAHFPTLREGQISRDLAAAETSIVAVTGRPAKPLFRFPYGDRTAANVNAVNATGYLAVRWTVDTLGWEGTGRGITADEVLRRTLEGQRPGEIVLMHVGSNPDDGTTLDAEALPRTIDQLRAGFSHRHVFRARVRVQACHGRPPGGATLRLARRSRGYNPVRY